MTDATQGARPIRSAGTLRRAAGQLLHEPLGIAALAVLVLVALAAILAPVISGQDPLFQNRTDILIGPTAHHWFGTDDIGRDVFSRVLHGTRTSLFVGAMVVVVTGIVGGTIGLVSGYFGGWVDLIIQRFVDALYALPSLVLALFIAALLGPSIRNVIIAVSLVQVPRFARVARAEMMRIRSTDYVSAARVIGTSPASIILRHGVPNALPAMLIMGSLAFGVAIITEAALSFLGVGTPPPHPSLGTMLSQGTRFIGIAPWLVLFPGLMLSINVLALNLLGDALRDIFDPRTVR